METKELLHDTQQPTTASSEQLQNTSASPVSANTTLGVYEDQQETRPPPTMSSPCTLDAVSGFAFGSLLSYVQEFGTPHQSSRASHILNFFLEAEENPLLLKQRASRRRGAARSSSSANEAGAGISADMPDREEIAEMAKRLDWPSLRQLLYEISGDWLWRHACHNFRTAVAPQVTNIPEALREEALRVKKPIEYSNDVILNDKSVQERGYVPFNGYVFPGSDAYYEDAT
mmetsp:Transcript_38326/g.78131  ORF Transcript_38326/g.78131 Transcript_38326/m.78131 type:complete len:230 (+) Transcript_38326:2616-3305(+)